MVIYNMFLNIGNLIFMTFLCMNIIKNVLDDISISIFYYIFFLFFILFLFFRLICQFPIYLFFFFRFGNAKLSLKRMC